MSITIQTKIRTSHFWAQNMEPDLKAQWRGLWYRQVILQACLYQGLYWNLIQIYFCNYSHQTFSPGKRNEIAISPQNTSKSVAYQYQVEFPGCHKWWNLSGPKWAWQVEYKLRSCRSSNQRLQIVCMVTCESFSFFNGSFGFFFVKFCKFTELFSKVCGMIILNCKLALSDFLNLSSLETTQRRNWVSRKPHQVYCFHW